ncbi:MAG: TonB-dependent receptor [Muribaculaceae bacterium]|nr:TonB-dependent receptor [Muribaculaceae bacterium]
MKKFKARYLTALTAAMLGIGSSYADIDVRGTVTDTAGEPIIGASVLEKSTLKGTATDIDGNFKITVPDNSILRFSAVGYEVKDAKAESSMKIVLKESADMLDDLVVIGYGTQKKSVVTAAISSISSDDLEMTAPVRVDNALKGLASGVTVTSSSGQPGAAARVRIRGIGTINNSDPLYIVDGMPIEGGLDYLNPADIVSIEVLKDAASGAVYGARAANGVVLVTTRQGQTGRAKVTYGFSYGWQSVAKKRSVLNASEYAMMINEGYLNSGVAPLYADPASYGEGTDWQEEVFNDNAPVMNHQVAVSGGSEAVKYMLSLGYYDQDGIVGGNFNRSDYNRLTLRSNLGITLFDQSSKRSWLNKATIQTNLAYTRIKSHGIEANSTWGSPLGSALAMSPILTPYLEKGSAEEAAQLSYLSNQPDYVPMYGDDGRLVMVPTAFGNFQEMSNPIANLMLPGNKNWSHKFVGNFSGDLQIWDNLHYRISYGADLSFWGYDGYTPLYYLRDGGSSSHSSATSTSERGLVWQIENILSYDKTIGAHSFSVLLGQSAKESSGQYLGGSRNNIINYDRPWIDGCTGLAANGDMTVWGAPQVKSKLASYFARVSYDYDSRYMIQATVRRDGSSRFGANNHWATFPSVSAGWNIMNEHFMESSANWLNNMKLRASWGKNGNENIGNFQYVALTSTNNNAIFGNPGSITIGTKPSQLANPDLRWEESESYDVGLDFGFLSNTLTFSADWFLKKTNGMLMTMSLPQYVGESIPVGNVGKMQNWGLEFDLGFRHEFFNQLTVGVSANLSYLKNKLIAYGNEQGWANLDSFQGVGTILRAQNGLPFPYFYGYKTDGIIQNMAEANEYNTKYGTSLVPGDVRFVDTDGNGSINEDDRTNIGNGTPDWTYGASLNLAWKGFDFNIFFQGVAGNDIFDATRRVDARSVNLPSWMLDRWTGEGTSDRIPRFVIGDGYNWQSSDLYVYDGSYCRLKNMQLGYTVPADITKKIGVQKFRAYVAVENLATWTKYHGYDPEISSGSDRSNGIDFGVYPQARTWTVGFNIEF